MIEECDCNGPYHILAGILRGFEKKDGKQHAIHVLNSFTPKLSRQEATKVLTDVGWEPLDIVEILEEVKDEPQNP